MSCDCSLALLARGTWVDPPQDDGRKSPPPVSRGARDWETSGARARKRAHMKETTGEGTVRDYGDLHKRMGVHGTSTL